MTGELNDDNYTEEGAKFRSMWREEIDKQIDLRGSKVKSPSRMESNRAQ